MNPRSTRRAGALARWNAERLANGQPIKTLRGRLGIWQPGDEPLPLQDIHPSRYRSEDAEGKVLWTDAQMGLLGPHVKRLLIHIPNGGGRSSAAQGAILKAQGVRAGVHDYFLPMPVGNTPGLWVELKASDGKPSDTQLEWYAAMRDVGYAACFAYGAAAAADAIKRYTLGILR